MSVIEVNVQTIFIDFPYWVHLVWGRREGYLKKANGWLDLIYESDARHYYIEDLLYMVVDPRSWLDDPNHLVPLDLVYIYATVPSEGITERIRDM